MPMALTGLAGIVLAGPVMIRFFIHQPYTRERNICLITGWQDTRTGGGWGMHPSHCPSRSATPWHYLCMVSALRHFPSAAPDSADFHCKIPAPGSAMTIGPPPAPRPTAAPADG